MRKKMMSVCLISLTALMINACGVQNVTRGMKEGEQYDAVISVKGNTAGEESGKEKEEEKEDDGLTGLLALIGKTDEEAAGLYGGGKENLTMDGGYLIGRIYTVQCLGTERNAYTTYEEDAVSLIFVDLSGTNPDECLTLLEDWAGQPGKTVKNSPEEKSWEWKVKDCLVTLYATDGEASLDIVPDGDSPD